MEWITKEGLIRIQGWARDGLSDEQIAKNIGVSRSTLNEWKKRFPDISDTLKKGKDIADREVENALFKRAVGYEFIEVTKERIIDTGQKKRHGGESKLTEKEWGIALAYFDKKCAYCRNDGEMTKDHLNPLKNGGELSFSNVVPACRSCNSSKKDHQWLAWYQKQSFYDPSLAKRITEYIQFTMMYPQDNKENEKGELIVTKEVIKQIAPDTGAAAFWLKNRKPDVWRDKQEVEHTGKDGEPMTFKIEL